MCHVTNPSMLLSMLSLVEASCLGGKSGLLNVAAKVEEKYQCGSPYPHEEVASHI
jgi:hypothetical protein